MSLGRRPMGLACGARGRSPINVPINTWVLLVILIEPGRNNILWLIKNVLEEPSRSAPSDVGVALHVKDVGPITHHGPHKGPLPQGVYPSRAVRWASVNGDPSYGMILLLNPITDQYRLS